jgi:hypothetical protein
MKTSFAADLTICWTRKFIASLAVILLCASFLERAVQAASIGPDDFGYVATDTVPYAFEDISGSGTSVLIGEDDTSITVPLGFTFPFYGVGYNNVSFTPNGLITFGGVNSEFGNQNLAVAPPLGDLPSAAVLWDDWIVNPGKVYYQTLGIVGARRFIVQWQQIQSFGGNVNSNVTFQAVLYETSGVLKFQYADTEVGAPNAFASFGGSATVGIRDTGGNSNGRVLQWSFNSPVIASGLAIQFRPSRRIGPDTYGYTATDNTPFAFEDISLTGTSVLAGSDDGTISVPLGFSFNFYGTNYTTAGLSPNGLITFGGVNGQFGNIDITSDAPTFNLPSVAVLWDDWTASPGSVFYQTLGSAPSRRFIAQWNQVRHVGGLVASNVTFQVILYEANQCLKFQYVDVDVDPGVSGWSFGGGATVGIRDRFGNLNGRNLQWSFNQATLCNTQAILLSPWGVGRVAVFGAPSTDAWNDDVRSKIALRMTNIQVDAFLINGFNPPPTLSQLLQYRSVLVYSDVGFSGNTALGNVLADYVDAGGGVVLATFAFWDTGALSIQGRLKTGGYLPFTTAGQTNTPSLTLVPDVPAHPLLNGVSSFNGGGGSYHNFFINVRSNAQLVAHWSNGQPLVGALGVSQGRVVGLNFYPPSSDAGGASFWTANTDGGLLMANALKWAGAPTRIVSVFDDPVYVDTSNNSGAESDNVQASLRSLGFTVTTFTNIAAAAATNKILLIPEQENAALGPALGAGNRAALSNFVVRGGLLIVHGSDSGRTAGLLNSVFGFAVTETGQGFLGTMFLTNGATGTAFADDSTSIPINDGSTTLLRNSLPPGSRNIYESAGSNAVVLISFGSGKIVYLGWDWWNAAPVGTQDSGWLQVLASAVTEADSLSTFNLLTLDSTDKGWYDSTGFHSAVNDNYACGEEIPGFGLQKYRNFFVFTIPSLTNPVVSAELRVNLYGAASPSGSENYELHAVSTAISTLSAGGSGLTAIYDDLADGVLYGGRVIFTNESFSIITIPLNASFVAALPGGGGQIALGGNITSFDGIDNDEWLFAFSNGSLSDAQLVLKQNVTRLPAIQLKIAYLPPNAVQLSWPLTPDNWQLQVSPSISSPTWVSVPDAPAIIGNQRVVVLPATDGQMFFRLFQTP